MSEISNESNINESNISEGRRIGLLHGVYALAILAASAVFFLVGYRAGTLTAAAPVSAAMLYEEAEKPVYAVRARNGKLCLYEIAAGSETLLESERISLEVFPEPDREKLAEGIEFAELTDAQALYEDFVN